MAGASGAGRRSSSLAILRVRYRAGTLRTGDLATGRRRGATACARGPRDLGVVAFFLTAFRAEAFLAVPVPTAVLRVAVFRKGLFRAELFRAGPFLVGVFRTAFFRLGAAFFTAFFLAARFVGAFFAVARMGRVPFFFGRPLLAVFRAVPAARDLVRVALTRVLVPLPAFLRAATLEALRLAMV